jgi:vacuolar-type H+-ATPase subunit H
MITNDRNPHPPDGEEPLEELFRNLFDLADQSVAGITDAQVDARLRGLLHGPRTSSDEDVPSLFVHDEAVTQSTESIVTRARSRAREILAAAHREAQAQARQIAAEARDRAERIMREADSYDDAALERAAQIIADARGQADSIVADARDKAERIILAARKETAPSGELVAFDYSGHPGTRVHAALWAPRPGFDSSPGIGVVSLVILPSRHGRGSPDGSAGGLRLMGRFLRRLLGPPVSADWEYVSAWKMLWSPALRHASWEQGHDAFLPEARHIRPRPFSSFWSGAPAVRMLYGSGALGIDGYAPPRAVFVAGDEGISVATDAGETYSAKLSYLSDTRAKMWPDAGRSDWVSFEHHLGGLQGPGRP